MYSFLRSVFNHSQIKSDSPYLTIERKVSYLHDGSEVITYEPVDFDSIKKANGKASLWNISTLVKSGINPSSVSGASVNTSRLDSYSQLSDIKQSVENFFDSVESESSESSEN